MMLQSVALLAPTTGQHSQLCQTGVLHSQQVRVIMLGPLVSCVKGSLVVLLFLWFYGGIDYIVSTGIQSWRGAVAKS